MPKAADDKQTLTNRSRQYIYTQPRQSLTHAHAVTTPERKTVSCPQPCCYRSRCEAPHLHSILLNMSPQATGSGGLKEWPSPHLTTSQEFRVSPYHLPLLRDPEIVSYASHPSSPHSPKSKSPCLDLQVFIAILLRTHPLA